VNSYRTRPIALLLVVLLIVNGYCGIVLYTFLLGERVDARITSCHVRGKEFRCAVTWRTASGATGTGRVPGASTSVPATSCRCGSARSAPTRTTPATS
jgi:hypothetical protein